MRALLKFIGENSFKQYEVIAEQTSETEGTFTVRYGRIGGTQTETTVMLPAQELQSSWEKQTDAKVRKGYVLVEFEGPDGSTYNIPHPNELRASGGIVEPPVNSEELSNELEIMLKGL